MSASGLQRRGRDIQVRNVGHLKASATGNDVDVELLSALDHKASGCDFDNIFENR
jgi:hypothetical protein